MHGDQLGFCCKSHGIVSVSITGNATCKTQYQSLQHRCIVWSLEGCWMVSPKVCLPQFTMEKAAILVHNLALKLLSCCCVRCSIECFKDTSTVYEVTCMTCTWSNNMITPGLLFLRQRPNKAIWSSLLLSNDALILFLTSYRPERPFTVNREIIEMLVQWISSPTPVQSQSSPSFQSQFPVKSQFPVPVLVLVWHWKKSIGHQ